MVAGATRTRDATRARAVTVSAERTGDPVYVARRTLTVVARASCAVGSCQSPSDNVPLWYEASYDSPISR
ncbi:hypothetical protein SAM23877_6428 [Streptomyces ambofaciens ATCC 23877]|uniref:Uncharacterized protein n=1 Tax=Streptomyces ambofaciens (strain ATCC 23877 / 3486 / DSM 40053 / JCM 4204 / NBRC 12836 / NRRL B-2516) TaxID=278992 RepID=A0A0K2B2N0_STRA7|nr:hypothetical protein SAM23877_6428 [Streptomyces ambofaciens ATCC 23877]